MTRDSTETPPAGGPPEPAPDDAREVASPEARAVPQGAQEEPPMASEMELQADPLDLPLPTEPPEPQTPPVEPPPELIAAEPTPSEPELVAPTTTRTGEPAEIDPRELDPDALKVVLRLHGHGHQAYLVGGCVRDLLLKRKPKDFDVATSAHPGEVRATFRNCRLIGRRFRLAHVYFKGGKIIEVSTFRANPLEMEVGPEEESAEGGNGNGDDLLITHDNVFGTAEQDARRRDFTINGLFYDVTEGRVIDYVRGRRDLDEQYIRTIGDPEIRMREDPVRILRAVRFASRLGFDIESRTYAAMEGAVEDLPRCAPARLLEETFRLIRGGVAAPSLKLLSALDALKILLPPVDAYLRRGREEERVFYAFAEALDRRVASGEPLDDAILLATLLMPISRAAPPPAEPQEAGAKPSVAQAIEELLAGFVQTARLPRRIAERCRLLLLAQRTLTGERRRRSASFRKHPLFGEALTVFEISVEATGEFREALEAWKSGELPPVRTEAAAGEGEPGRKRRRRRRRKGGRQGGGAEAAAPSGEANESAGAAEDTGSDSGSDADEPDGPDDA
ncbi:MAG: polynucleotide adenylyltransferase PcnB [Myxococcaceae bacterium]|nr:polynucleotide adenylyltransferase PcnB [Myxococcaceae bacterium]